MRDLAVTWPKSKPLATYLRELEDARQGGLEINFRIASKPSVLPARCYMVHSGYIRGYTLVRSVVFRAHGEVARVRSDPRSGFWPAGWYIVRDPLWHPITPVPMRGFQGYRYIARPQGGH